MEHELSELLATNYYPRFKRIHDCVDTGTPLAIVADTPILYPCDCAVRNYKSDGVAIFDNGNVKDSIANAVMGIKLRGVVNGPINTVVLFKLSIPHPTLGTIPIDTLSYVISKNNTDVEYSISTEIYNGTDSDAHLYGFDITLEANQNITLSERSIYART